MHYTCKAMRPEISEVDFDLALEVFLKSERGPGCVEGRTGGE